MHQVKARMSAVIMLVSLAPGAGAQEDARVAVTLTAVEKTFVLGQMRLFVESVERIVTALATEDRAAAAEAAAARGAQRFQAANDMPASLSGKLPEQWRAFGRPMRQGFDAFAQGVADGEDKSRALARLGEIMRNCVGCHASYRIVDARD
jgi:hypothetical protein